MKKKNLLKRGFASLFVVVMAVGLLPIMPSNMTTVQAADGDATTKTIEGLGTSVIADPTAPTSTSSAWTGSYVYFGTYGTDDEGNPEPVKYRVLDSNTTVFGGTTMLLDCDSVLWAGTNNDNQSSAFDSSSNVQVDTTTGEGCDIRSYLNGTFLTNNFSTAEQSDIASSTKSAADSSDGDGWSYLNSAPLSNDKIFFLDAKEATNESYGYSNTYYEAANREKTGGNAYWWLRSAYTNISNYAVFVYSDGSFPSYGVTNYTVGVSPALNIDLSSVLFSSVISGTAGQTNAEYKLTLIDSDMTVAVNGTVARNGDTLIIPYTVTGTNSGSATQVSVLVLDKEYTVGNTNEANVLSYGALNTGSFSTTGAGTYTLPSDLSGKVIDKDYFVYVIAEDVNGTYETDYASTPVKISIPLAMNFCVNGIGDPVAPASTSSDWTGNYVYFGTYNGSPVKYRVLDSETSVFGGTTMLLDCDSVLWAGTNSDGQSSAFDDSSNVWVDTTTGESCDIRTYLNETFLTSNFSATEQSAIASSTKSAVDSSDGDGWSYLNYASLSNDKIFFLDAKEATNTSYGYSNTYDNAANRVKTNAGVNDEWWLRSADSSLSRYAGCVYSENGFIYTDIVTNWYVGVSPALNVNLSSVLFSSASGTSKSSALAADSSQIGTTTVAEWKLTLEDERKTVKVTDNEVVSKAANGTITVPYTYTATADAEKVNQISVMITDRAYTKGDAAILYYGALQGTDYHVYILAEHTTDTNATDYASTPVEITDIYNEVSSVTVAVDAPASEEALDTSATVSSDIKDAVITWLNGNSEVTGNADYNTAYTVKVTLTAIDGYAFTDNTTVKVNGKAVTATKNNDGTITVSYTFPATEEGTITYTVAGYEGTYDGKAHSITVNVTDPADATVTYSTDEGDNKTYTATNPTFTDAGTYTVYYRIEKARRRQCDSKDK